METKKVTKIYSIFTHEKEEKFLRDMHKSGWKFIKVTGLGRYHFEKCEPKDVIYQLDYNKDGLKNKDEYVKMFADCGWEYMQTYCGYTYFRKSANKINSNEEIFCDNESKLQMIKRVYLGRMLPLLIIFLSIIIPTFIRLVFTEHDYIFASIYAVILLIYVWLFIAAGIKYKKLKNNSNK